MRLSAIMVTVLSVTVLNEVVVAEESVTLVDKMGEFLVRSLESIKKLFVDGVTVEKKTTSGGKKE